MTEIQDRYSLRIICTPILVNNLDYFEADSPLGLSTFGLSSLTGNNNPFQMIIFAIETVINPENPAHADSRFTGGEVVAVQVLLR